MSQIETCAADGCPAVPRHPTSWTPQPSGVRRWFCPEHAHLAEPGDLEPARPEYRFSRSGGIEPVISPAVMKARWEWMRQQ